MPHLQEHESIPSTEPVCSVQWIRLHNARALAAQVEEVEGGNWRHVLRQNKGSSPGHAGPISSLHSSGAGGIPKEDAVCSAPGLLQLSVSSTI